MKSFTLFIIAAIVASAAAINEPVASPTDSIERELAEYERQLGTGVTGAPTATPGRPTDGSRGGRIHIAASCRRRMDEHILCTFGAVIYMKRRVLYPSDRPAAPFSSASSDRSECLRLISSYGSGKSGKGSKASTKGGKGSGSSKGGKGDDSMSYGSYSSSYSSGKSGKGSSKGSKGDSGKSGKGSGSKGGKGGSVSMSYGSYSSSYASSGKAGKRE
eukprot:scaffold24554_cov80-Skeletonema_marinoi.AAC.1